MKALKLMLLSLLFISVSCTTTKIVNLPITDFPTKPVMTDYTRKPIISKTDKDFFVSDEFVNNSVLLKKYSDRIDAWKMQNKVQ